MFLYALYTLDQTPFTISGLPLTCHALEIIVSPFMVGCFVLNSQLSLTCLKLRWIGLSECKDDVDWDMTTKVGGTKGIVQGRLGGTASRRI